MGVPTITGVRATGMSILVELINPEEMVKTTIVTPEGGAKDLIDGASQAYVLDMGPKVDPEEWGFGAGDRIMFSGNFVPAYNYDKHERSRGTIDPHSVKAVFDEE